jgi:hypothetical protein
MKLKTYSLTLCVCGIMAGPALADNAWTPWVDLATHTPDKTKMMKARADRGHSAKSYDVQDIAEGWGKAVNVDEYVVRIDKLPNGWTKSQFTKYVRINLNSLLDQKISKFGPFSSGDGADWKSGVNAKLGTIMVFDIATVGGVRDDGAVVVSKTSADSWIFSPIKDGLLGDFGTHPVAGNRQFGVRKKGETLEFYTRAFDRVYAIEAAAAEGRAFEGADKLWRSMQTNLEVYVNTNGGSASAQTPTTPGGNVPSKKPQYVVVCKDPAVKLDC